MTQFVVANFISTTLSAAAAAGATSMTLSSSTGLPTLAAGQVMPLTLNDAATGLIFEIVYVTAIAGAVCTVTRAQEGTSAQNWNIGDLVYCAPTSGTITAIQAIKTTVLLYQLANGTAGGGVTSGWTTQLLNTTQNDDIGITLSGGQFTLPAGKYLIEGWATITGSLTSHCKLNIYNSTSSTHLLQGSSMDSNGTSESPGMIPRVNGVITIAGAQSLELYLYANNSQPQLAASSGQPEVYAGVTITALTT